MVSISFSAIDPPHRARIQHRGKHGDDLGRLLAAQPCRLHERFDLLIDLVERGSHRFPTARAALGLSQMICRTSSDPIEPPAPVTITDLPVMLRAKQRRVGTDGIAAQEILGLDRSQVADGHAPSRQIFDGRQRADAHLQLLQLLQCRPAFATLRPRHRQQHFFDRVLTNEAGHALG